MKSQRKKLICLNLALLILITLTCPISAQEADTSSPSSTLLLEDGVELLSTSESFSIRVNGNFFTSAANASGEGWTYNATQNILQLNNYNGSSICASGDLTIFTSGNTTITGASGTYFGSDGICVDGGLTLYNFGNTTITGGSGSYQPGQGIYTSGNLYLVNYSTTYVYGGDNDETTSSTSTTLCAGHGICAVGSICVEGSYPLIVKGGCAGTGEGNQGGHALYAYDITINSPFAFQGGDGYTSGAGVYCVGTCTFGAVNGYYRTGTPTYAYYPAYIGNNAPSYHEHTTVTQYSSDSSSPAYAIEISCNEYTLLLNGMGGTYNGYSLLSLTGQYPCSCNLANYIFERTGYVQVGWATASDLYPLNTVYQLEGDISLGALWVAAQNGDIVLNGLQGTFPSTGTTGTFYLHSSSSVQLPSALTYESDELLAWCSELSPVADKNTYQFSGQWHAGGTTVAPDAEAITQLYAQSSGSGQYALYHLNGGSAADGSTLLVQGCHVSSSDLSVYTLSAEDISAPAGYEFSGWYNEKTGVLLSANTKLTLPRETTTHLYAQWTPAKDEYVSEDGISISFIPLLNTVRVSIPTSLCAEKGASTCIAALYSSSGKMLFCEPKGYQSGTDVVLEFSYDASDSPTCKVFLLNDNNIPVRVTANYTPSAD